MNRQFRQPVAGMRRIPGGTFMMGSDHHYPEEAPAHRVRVAAFEMDETAVTNRQFAAFVADTGYVTIAERSLDPALYPMAAPQELVPGSTVFHMTSGPVDLRDFRQWWAWVPGASWRNPEGPGSSIKGRKDHPVVHVAFEDAEAYAAWAGKALPTEAEWERAARGGLEGKEFAWGDELVPRGRHVSNTWQGAFPWQNTAEDGHVGTCPVKSFSPNGFGLYEVCGNVWEWTTDWFGPGHSAASLDHPVCCTTDNPRGPAMEKSYDPSQPQTAIPRRVVKGGSYLCAPSYCRRYRPAARHPQMVDTGTSHIGFRCINRSV
jgi:formylglycine-generating enzyme required for sulfatase activity